MATHEQLRDRETGRYQHEWGVVAQDFTNGYVEIYGCHTCDKFDTSEGGKLLTYKQLQTRYPNAREADSDVPLFPAIGA